MELGTPGAVVKTVGGGKNHLGATHHYIHSSDIGRVDKIEEAGSET